LVGCFLWIFESNIFLSFNVCFFLFYENVVCRFWGDAFYGFLKGIFF